MFCSVVNLHVQDFSLRRLIFFGGSWQHWILALSLQPIMRGIGLQVFCVLLVSGVVMACSNTRHVRPAPGGQNILPLSLLLRTTGIDST
jgi:hypothetical protein